MAAHLQAAAQPTTQSREDTAWGALASTAINNVASLPLQLSSGPGIPAKCLASSTDASAAK